MVKLILLLLFAIVGSTGLVGVISYIRFTPPQEVVSSQPLWIPVGAEVHSSNEVRPGTFTTDITLQKLQETTNPDQRVIVVYATSDQVPPARGGPSLTYYRPKKDGSDYDYLKIAVPLPSRDMSFRDSLFTKWEASFDEQNHVFQFTLVKYVGSLLASIAVAAVGGVLFWLVLKLPNSIRRRIAPVPPSPQ